MRLSLLFFTFFPFVLQAQVSPSFKWAKQFSGSSKMIFSRSIVSDNQGNVYQLVRYQDTLDADPGAGVQLCTEEWGYCLIKLGPSGNLIWWREFVNAKNLDITKIHCDGSQAIYFTGKADTLADFDPGPGVQRKTVPWFSPYILKLDLNGQFVWLREFESIFLFHGITTNSQGDILAGGVFSGTEDFDPGPGSFTLSCGWFAQDYGGMVACYSSSGNFKWAFKLTDGDWDRCTEMIVDAENNFYCGGFFDGTVNFNPLGSSYSLTAWANDGFVAKYRSNGQLVWARQFKSNNFAPITSICVDSRKQVTCSGQFLDVVDADPGPSTVNFQSASPGYYSNCYMASLDSLGNYLWGKNFSSTFELKSLKCDVSDNIYAWRSNYSSSSGSIVSYNKQGNLRWSVPLNDNCNPNFMNAQRIALLFDTVVYADGAFNSLVDFDPGAGTYTFNATVDNSYVLCLKQPGTYTVNTTGLKTEIFGSFYFYPNPSKGTIYFSEPADGILRLWDIKGTLLKEEVLERQDRVELQLPPGAYILECASSAGAVRKKLIVCER